MSGPTRVPPRGRWRPLSSQTRRRSRCHVPRHFPRCQPIVDRSELASNRIWRQPQPTSPPQARHRIRRAALSVDAASGFGTENDNGNEPIPRGVGTASNSTCSAGSAPQRRAEPLRAGGPGPPASRWSRHYRRLAGLEPTSLLKIAEDTARRQRCVADPPGWRQHRPAYRPAPGRASPLRRRSVVARGHGAGSTCYG
jgi:hypothetical protein